MVMSNSALTYQRQLLERDALGMVNRMAVECQKMIRTIEAHPHWKAHAELRHWWGAFCTARTALTQSPPSKYRSRAEQEIDALIDALGSEDGVPGGAAVTSSPLPVTITFTPTWPELLGDQ
jgi:hypothetical protein